MIFKNGGILAEAGTYMILIIAKQLAKTVLAISDSYKMSGKYALDQNTFN